MQASEIDAVATPAPAWRRRTLRIAPWLVASAALALILYRYPPAQIAVEMRRGNTLAMVPWAVCSALASWAIVGYADSLVIHSCLERPRLADIMRGLAGSAVLNAFGYMAGLGGYALWIARASGSKLRLGVGLVLYIASSELAAVATLAALTLWTGHVAAPQALRWGATLIAALLCLIKLARPQRLLRKFGEASLWRPWQAISLRRAALELCLRLLQMSMLGTMAWLGASGFGLTVPLPVMIGVVALVLLVVSLPVNVAGFGAVQGVWLLLLPWATSGEQVLAFSVLWQLLVGGAAVLRGLPFAKRVMGEAVAAEARR